MADKKVDFPLANNETVSVWALDQGDGTFKLRAFAPQTPVGDHAVLYDLAGNPLITASGDAAIAANALEVVHGLINSGGTIDLQRDANTANGTAGMGIVPMAPMLYTAGAIYNRQSTPAALGDGAGGSQIAADTNFIFNGATYDRRRGNAWGTLLASAARTATTTSPTQTNYNAKAMVCFLNITANASAGGIYPTLFEVDPLSGAAVQVTSFGRSSTKITTTGLFAFSFAPQSANLGIAAGDNVVGWLPRSWYMVVNHSDASSVTYSVSFQNWGE